MEKDVGYKKSYPYSTEEPFPCPQFRESSSSQVQQTVLTYYFKLPYVGSFTKEAQKRLRKLVQRCCTTITSKLS